MGPLQQGLVRTQVDDVFNIKNPACYVYPEENDCEPGDHFSLSQEEDAQRFVSRQAFSFQLSRTQQLANGITLSTLAASLLFVLWLAFRRIRDRVRGV